MKKRKSISLDDSLVITLDNVQTIGEKIAVCAVKNAKRFSNGALDRLYKGLVHNISCNLRIDEQFSDGYDIAQEAICYLCHFIGHQLGEVCVPNIHKGLDCIRLGCYKHLYAYLRQQRKHIQDEEDIELYLNKNILKQEKTPNYNKVIKIIKTINLNEQETDIALYLAGGVSIIKIAEFTNVCKKTIYKKKAIIKAKYLSIFN